MRALLVRVAADLSDGGGSWNGPVDELGNFAYVAIPESSTVHPGTERPYAKLAPVLARFGTSLPRGLQNRHMHLDPDFEHLTYGDHNERAKQIRSKLKSGDLLVFYAGLASRNSRDLVYAIIGLFVIEEIVAATSVPDSFRDTNAHSRRILAEGSSDIIVRARKGRSGRLGKCIPIGEWRDRAYRLRPDVMESWGGVSVKNGYLQRSARLPEILNPGGFLEWLRTKDPILLETNN